MKTQELERKKYKHKKPTQLVHTPFSFWTSSFFPRFLPLSPSSLTQNATMRFAFIFLILTGLVAAASAGEFLEEKKRERRRKSVVAAYIDVGQHLLSFHPAPNCSVPAQSPSFVDRL